MSNGEKAKPKTELRDDSDLAPKKGPDLDAIGADKPQAAAELTPHQGPINHTDRATMRSLGKYMSKNLNPETGLPRIYNRVKGVEVTDRGEVERVLSLMELGRNFDPFSPFPPKPV